MVTSQYFPNIWYYKIKLELLTYFMYINFKGPTTLIRVQIPTEYLIVTQLVSYCVLPSTSFVSHSTSSGEKR